MDVPTIEQQAGSAVGSSSGTAQAMVTDQGQQARSGPSVTLSFSDGSTATLNVEDLQVLLAAVQTLLLLYVTYKEVSS